MVVKKKNTLNSTKEIGEVLNTNTHREDTQHTTNSMRGLFFVVKGSYKKGVEPSFVNRINGDTYHLGGYNPTLDTTEEWYMVLDRKTFNCVSCGGDLEKVVKGVYCSIKRHKGNLSKYLSYVGGKETKLSPIMRCLYEQVYSEYGDYFSERVEEMEDLAYEELKENKPLNKTRKILSKTPKKTKVFDTTTPAIKEEVSYSSPKKLVMPKKKFGIKKLSMV